MATILIVDDNVKNRNVLKDMVVSFGYTPVLAENGIEALAKMKKQSPDMVLLDLLMPKMNGFEVLDHMKGDSNLRHIPVIMISAVGYVYSVIQCIEKGADDYLDKPFNPKLLKARMNSSLEKKRLRGLEKEHLKKLQIEKKRSDDLLTKIIPIGLGLFSESVFDRLLEKILLESMSFSNADAGTLYRRVEGDLLKFEIVRTNSLGNELPRSRAARYLI